MWSSEIKQGPFTITNDGQIFLKLLRLLLVNILDYLVRSKHKPYVCIECGCFTYNEINRPHLLLDEKKKVIPPFIDTVMIGRSSLLGKRTLQAHSILRY